MSFNDKKNRLSGLKGIEFDKIILSMNSKKQYFYIRITACFCILLLQR